MSYIQHLSVDPVLAKLIKKFGELEIKSDPNLFEHVISSIISQQLSVKASDTIEKRFTKLFGDKFPKPKQILKMDAEKIRECGISYPKIGYIKGIAEAVDEGRLKIDDLPNLPDEEVLEELIKLKGIGRWTGEMLLIFALGRQDIFSMGDLGLRNAISKLYGIDRDNLVEIEKITLKWSPYRSFASRYLWLSLDNI